MNRKQAKRSSIFLLELMIAILFFCLASAVCIRLFVKSHTISLETQNLNMALNQVSSVAEVFRSGTDMKEFLEREFPDYEEKSENLLFLVYYNEDWEPCREREAIFCLSIEFLESGSETTGHFSMKNINTGAEIYAVSLEKFKGEAMQ